MENMKNEIWFKKAKYFFDNRIAIHIVINGGAWYNGFIKEISAEFFIIEDREDGRLPIFFEEINSIREFKERREE